MPENSEPRFSGVPTTPPPEVFERARRNQPVWYRILESAVSQFAARPENAGIYAAPGAGGATVQQIWLLFTLFRIEPYCLLARPLPAASTQLIRRLVNCTPVQLVEALKSIQAAEGDIKVSLAYYDGKTGHCIRVTAYDSVRDRFIYHDPWPERSLLAKENNAAEVDAQPEGKRWSVTAQELERVAFAAFVFPAEWARVQGQNFDILYEQWRESQFFKFFHLKQLDEHVEGDLVQRVFAPGTFKEHIALLVDSGQTGKITCASLRLSRDWLINNFTLALDLAKSFVTCFAPPPDEATYGKIANALWNMRDPAILLKAKDADPNESDSMCCVHAFMGSPKGAEVATDFSHLSIRTGAQGDYQLLCMEFDLL
jgi:hypothetical protein